MRRRDLIAAGLVGLAASPARASETPAAAGPAHVDLSVIGLPVISDGRVRNYVFTEVRLHLTPSTDAQAVRQKIPFFREGLIRAAHATPFTVSGDWNRVDPARLAAAVMHVAPRLVGPGVVARVEVVAQSPRRRTRSPAA